MSYKTEPALWLVVSLLLFVIGTQAAWRFRHLQSRSADWLRRRLVDSFSGWLLLQATRLLYFVGLPYAAVLRRVLSPVKFGLLKQNMTAAAGGLLGWPVTDWLQALGWLAGMGLLIAVLLALGWRNAARAQEGRLVARGLWPAPPWWVTAREVFFSQAHWAFYRAVPLMVMGDSYWVILSSAVLPVFEWVLDPDWRQQVRDGPRREQALVQFLWLATTTVYFVLTQNSWLALALHMSLAIALNYGLAFWARQQETNIAPASAEAR